MNVKATLACMDLHVLMDWITMSVSACWDTMESTVNKVLHTITIADFTREQLGMGPLLNFCKVGVFFSKNTLLERTFSSSLSKFSYLNDKVFPLADVWAKKRAWNHCEMGTYPMFTLICHMSTLIVFQVMFISVAKSNKKLLLVVDLRVQRQNIGTFHWLVLSDVLY